MIPAEEVRDLARRLVAIPSASLDLEGVRACGAALETALPAGVAHGAWPTPDGRSVLWALVRGRGPRTVVLLGHHDTVGATEYATLGAPQGAGIAFDPDALRAHLIAGFGDASSGPASDTSLRRLQSDLAEEARAPGTWMFGRGALDMKSGLAAAVAALGALAEDPAFEGSALLVVTPDEEHESLGMRAAVPEIARLRHAHGLEPVGAINLDYAAEPIVHSGVVGKIQACCYVIGRPAHAGDPLAGVDATQLAAQIVTRVTARRAMIDGWHERRGAPPVALRLRDLKEGYDVQTAAEAWVEFNLVTLTRGIEDTMSELRDAVVHALEVQGRSRGELAQWLGTQAPPGSEPGSARANVITWPELVARAGGAEETVAPEAPGNPRAAALDRVRALCRRAGLAGPAVVLLALPPYYPHAAPGSGPLAEAARELAREEGLAVRAFYPYISDASYLAWRGEPAGVVARHLPALGRSYVLPVEAAGELDLDVVSLGPWGRDAHGLFERVHAPFAFGRLPGLIARLVAGAARI